MAFNYFVLNISNHTLRSVHYKQMVSSLEHVMFQFTCNCHGVSLSRHAEALQGKNSLESGGQIPEETFNSQAGFQRSGAFTLHLPMTSKIKVTQRKSSISSTELGFAHTNF